MNPDSIDHDRLEALLTQDATLPWSKNRLYAALYYIEKAEGTWDWEDEDHAGHGLEDSAKGLPDRDSVSTIVEVCNAAPALIQRSRLLEKAASLLRRMPLDGDYYDEETVAELERSRRVFLARLEDTT